MTYTNKPTRQTALCIAVALALSACSSDGTGSGVTNGGNNGAPNMGSTITTPPSNNQQTNHSGSNTGSTNTNNTNTGSNNTVSGDASNSNTGNEAPATSAPNTGSTNTNNSSTTPTNPTGNTVVNNTTPNNVGNEFGSAYQIAQQNSALKANHQSLVTEQAQKAVKEATGKGAAVAVVDTGLDPSLYPTVLNTSKIDKTMDTSAGVRPLSQINEHGSEMSAVIVNKAPDAVQRHFGGTENDYTRDWLNQPAQSTFQTLANREDVTAKTIIISNSWSDRNYNTANLSGYRWPSNNMRAAYTTGATNGKTGLMLFATGNENNDNPANTARLPEINSSLKDYFLAVTGVDKDGRQVYNKCGAMADDCIAVRADEVIAAGSPQETTIYGTSPATASLAGNLAKVAGLHDWAEAPIIKEIATTTATRQADRASFGVGIFNPEKAINGLGAVNKHLTLNVNGVHDTYYFNNDISGTSGSLTKRGADTLALTGNNTYTGATYIEEGALLLNGQNKSAMNVKAGAKLVVGDNTKGISAGSVNNSGTLSAQSLADFTINGDFTNTGKVEKHIGSKIDVKGTANLAGELDVTGVAKGYVTRQGSRETVLSANQVNGKFETVKVSDSSLTNTTVAQDNKGVYATMGRNTIGDAVFTEGARSDGIRVSAETAEKVLSKIDTKLDQGQALSSTEQKYLNAFVENDNNVASVVFDNSTGTHERAQQTIAKNAVTRSTKVINNTQAGSPVWVDYNYNSPEYKKDEINTDVRENGVTVGAGFDINGHKVGVAFNQQTTNVDEQFGSVGRNVNAKVLGVDTAYVTRVGDVDVYATVGADRIKLEDNSGKGAQVRAGVGVSKPFMVSENMTVTPDAGLFYTESHLKDVDVNELTHANKLKFKNFGARVAVKGNYQVNQQVNVFGEVGVQHDLINKTHSTSKIAGVEVSNALNNRKDTRGFATIGVNTKMNNFTVGASVGYEKGRHSSNKTANIGLKYEF